MWCKLGQFLLKQLHISLDVENHSKTQEVKSILLLSTTASFTYALSFHTDKQKGDAFISSHFLAL